ncbi:MAG: NAD(P)-dependent oxidoreductase [Alphaproteobacteria bacterium]
MTLLITGGGGFVLSHLARTWLDAEGSARVVVLDASPLDPVVERFFAPVADRLDYIQADILAGDTLAKIADAHDITKIVHGATITSMQGEGGPAADPRRLLSVNIQGTAHLLHWATGLDNLSRFIHVSSGSVYGGGPAEGPVPEEGYVGPDGFYALSKWASELVANQYGASYGVPVVSVRFSGVYGPMDRITHARTVRCEPNRIAHLALAGETIKVDHLDGVGDWIHGGDVAGGLCHLLNAKAPAHAVYNIAYGELATIADLIAYVAEVVPGVRHEVVADTEANVLGDARRRTGRFGAYDIARMTDEFGWRPRPLRDAIHDYIAWLKES